MYGFINKGNTQASFYIRVDGYPEEGYLYYSLRDAICKGAAMAAPTKQEVFI